MKIWTEYDMEPVIKVIDDEIRHPYRSGARTRLLMIDLYHAITSSAHEIASVPSVEPERKKGKWEEKHHTFSGECPIDEWQSCRCSECGRYDTRPYMYYFSEPNYCSWCGAEMRQEKEAEE